MKTFSNKKNNKKQNMIKNNLMASVFGMSFIEGGWSVQHPTLPSGIVQMLHCCKQNSQHKNYFFYKIIFIEVHTSII